MIEDYGRDIEGYSNPLEGRAEGQELSESQVEYLKELNVDNDEWDELSYDEQDELLECLDSRMEELGIDPEDRVKVAQDILSPYLAEAYGEYFENTYNPYSPTSWERHPEESDEDYEERMEDQESLMG